MKTQRSILIGFLLNLGFAVFELIGGLFTGSAAIISDAVHDAGDAAGIGISWLLEKKSKQQADGLYTYGYSRYSVLGGFITTVILLLGSVVMIANGIHRLLYPTPINYNGMILFAIVGVFVNGCAAGLTHKGESLNQKAVSLHMLEDVLGWVVVLVGAIVMRFTDLRILDPLMSIGVSIFIFIHAFRHLSEIGDLFLEKAPVNIDTVRDSILKIEGISDVHHIHIRTIDGHSHCATMHIVTDRPEIKADVRRILHDLGICHATLEIEAPGEQCPDPHCHIHHKHHHHHH
jgi:cobalt-zinc-cadmium efflux system protein